MKKNGNNNPSWGGWGTCLESFLCRVVGFAETCPQKRPGRSKIKGRTLRLEEMEERTLLSVTPIEFDAIRTVYSDFFLPEESTRIQVTELTDLTAESLRSAVDAAAESAADDLIVIRTTENASTLSLADDPLVLRLSEDSGRLILAVWGEKSLTLVGGSSVINAVSGDIALGGITLVGMTGGDSDFSPSDLLTIEANARVTTSRLLYLTTKSSDAAAPASSSSPISIEPTRMSSLTGETTETFSFAAGADSSQNISIEFQLTKTEWVYMTGLTPREASDYQETIYALSESYYVDQYYDVNKYWTEDSQLCWAAASANILYYTGWANPDIDFYDVSNVYDYIMENFTNVGGHFFYAIPWFMNGEYDVTGQSGWAQPSIGSGAFYPDVAISDIREYFSSDDSQGGIIRSAGDCLKEGYGVALAIGWYSMSSPTDRRGGHSITMWGYVYDTAVSPDDPNYYTGVIVTDSDDRQTARVQLSLEWNAAYSQYRFSDYSGRNGWLEDATCLAPNPDNGKPDLDAPSLDAYVSDFSVTAEWTAVENAAGYALRYRQEGETSWNKIIVGNETTCYVLSDLAFWTEYEIQVQAFGDENYNDSDWSNRVSVMIVASPVVSTEADVVDHSDGLVSLREAILLAQPGSTITFDPSMAGKTIALNADLGSLVISAPLTIDAAALCGAAADGPGITIDALGLFRVFSVSGGTMDAPVRLIGLTLTGGETDENGGGIFASGVLSVTNCRISRNQAAFGGGIATDKGNVGVEIVNSIIASNSARLGGGIFQANGNDFFRVTNSTITGNSAQYGGGLFVMSGMTLTNSILAVNSADETGNDVYENQPLIDAFYSLSNYQNWRNRGSDGTNYVFNPLLPLFVDPTNGDYRLGKNSQAIDKGNSAYALDFNGDAIETDIGGDSRFVAKSVDLGAYENPFLTGDIDLDGFVGPGDMMFLSVAWFSSPSSDRWDERCDLDGDGFVGPNDYMLMSQYYFQFR